MSVRKRELGRGPGKSLPFSNFYAFQFDPLLTSRFKCSLLRFFFCLTERMEWSTNSKFDEFSLSLPGNNLISFVIGQGSWCFHGKIFWPACFQISISKYLFSNFKLSFSAFFNSESLSEVCYYFDKNHKIKDSEYEWIQDGGALETMAFNLSQMMSIFQVMKPKKNILEIFKMHQVLRSKSYRPRVRPLPNSPPPPRQRPPI